MPIRLRMLIAQSSKMWRAMAVCQGADHISVRLSQIVVHDFNSSRSIFPILVCRALRSVRGWLDSAGCNPILGREEGTLVTVARCRCGFCQRGAYSSQ